MEGVGTVASTGPAVTFPDPELIAKVAALEAAQPQHPVTFRWLVGITSALAFALVGGALYATIAYATDHTYGIVSLAIGIFAGLGAARGGRSRQAQIVGACAAAFGYFAGLIMAVIAIVGQRLFQLDLDQIGQLLWLIVKQTFTTMDALFLGIAVYNGWNIPRARP